MGFVKSSPERALFMTADIGVLLGVVAIAGLTQGVTGFGFGLLSMGLMVVLFPLQDAVVIVAILGLGLSLLNLWTVRTSIPWKEASSILLTALPAIALGNYFLRTLPLQVLRGGIAIMILIGCAVSLWTPQKALIHHPFPWAHLAGLVGGVFGGALNMGGPPAVLYTLLRGWEKSTAKGFLVAYFVPTSILRVILLSLTGMVTRKNLIQGGALLVPAILFGYLGTRIFQRISTRIFRYLATVLLLGLAIKIILS